MPSRQSFALAALAASLLGALPLTEPAPQDPQKPPPQDFVIEAGQHEVIELIERSAGFLGRNYIYSEADVQAIPDKIVKMQNRMALDAVACEEVVSQLAYSKGLVMLPLDAARGVYEWIHRQGPKRMELARAAAEMAPDEVLAIRRRAVSVMTSVPLQNLDANMMANQLRPLLAVGQGSGVTLVNAGGAVVLQGLAPDVASAIDLVRKLDKPTTTRTVDPATGATLPGDLFTPQWAVRVEQRLNALERTSKSTPK